MKNKIKYQIRDEVADCMRTKLNGQIWKSEPQGRISNIVWQQVGFQICVRVLEKIEFSIRNRILDKVKAGE